MDAERDALSLADALVRRARAIRWAVKTLSAIAADQDRRYDRDEPRYTRARRILDEENLPCPPAWRALAW